HATQGPRHRGDDRRGGGLPRLGPPRDPVPVMVRAGEGVRRRWIVRTIRHVAFRVLVGTSLLACVVAAVLWVRSYRPPGRADAVSVWVNSRQSRFTLRSQSGRLTLFAPPASPSGPPGRSTTGETADVLVQGRSTS